MFMVLPVLVQAVDYNVGVKVGDWIKYGQVTVAWNGTGTEPPSVMEEMKVDWLRIDVEYVSGTAVTLNATTHYNNGTQISSSIGVDVTEMSYALIASNLKKGDSITPRADSPTINQTTTGIYANASRNVNLLETTSVYENQTTTLKYYFDQSTGIPVEFYSKSPDNSNPGAYSESSWRATETNMWSPDVPGSLSNTLIYVIVAVVIIIVVIAVAIVLRKKKTPSTLLRKETS